MKLIPISLGCSALFLASNALLPAATLFEPLRLVSAADPTLPSSATPNGDSFGMQMAPDASWVLFLSDASDITTNLHQDLILELYLYERSSQSTTLMSVDSAGVSGGDGHAGVGQATPNGRYVAFESDARNLVPGVDTNYSSDIFVRDVDAGTTRLISVNADGTGPGLGGSQDPVITPDGRFVAFASTAEDLVSGDTNGLADVFVRDLIENTTEWISAESASPIFLPGVFYGSAGPRITADGRWIAFTSTATNMVAGVTNLYGEIYLRDRLQGTTICPSATAFAQWPLPDDATVFQRRAFNTALSEDGQSMAFVTEVTLRDPVQLIRALWHIEIASAQATLVTTNINLGAFIDQTLYTMTPDGRWLAYLTPTLNNRNDIEIWDSQTGATLPATPALDGSSGADGLCDMPELSADGRFLVFIGNPGNLVTNQTGGEFNVFVRDLEAGQTEVASVDAEGAALGGVELAFPEISRDGTWVLFDSNKIGYVPDDRNLGYDVFLRQREDGFTQLVSRAGLATPAASGNGLSSLGQSPFSEDGGRLVFRSESDNLAPGTVRGVAQVYVHDVSSGTNVLVSVNITGDGGANRWCYEQIISGNGGIVAFSSAADNLMLVDSNGRQDVFTRDLDAGSTDLVSRGLNSKQGGNNRSRLPTLNRDGNWVGFFSDATDLVQTPVTGLQGYLHNRLNRLTFHVTDVPPLFTGRTASLLAPDGRYFAYDDARGLSPGLRLYDRVTGLTTNVVHSPAQAALYGDCFSRDGQYLVTGAWEPTTGMNYLLRRNLADGTTQLIRIGFGPAYSFGDFAIDGHGRFLAFSASLDLVAVDTNQVTDVYLFDFASAALNLLSLNQDGTAAGGAASRTPSISGDGRLVAFASDADDLVSGDTNGATDVFVLDRQTGELSGGQHKSQWRCRGQSSANPHLSPEGYRLAFTSRAADIVPNDLNDLNDVFLTSVHPLQTTDFNGDGIEDQWELAAFGTLEVNLDDDADGDGFSNGQEYVAGTDPNDPQSHLRLEINATASGQIQLRWDASPGRAYRLESTSDPSRNSWADAPGIIRIAGSSASFEESQPVSATGYYRLQVIKETEP